MLNLMTVLRTMKGLFASHIKFVVTIGGLWSAPQFSSPRVGERTKIRNMGVEPRNFLMEAL